MTRLGLALAIGSMLAACDLDPAAPERLFMPELADFAARAQPVLAARCATPSCHGRADRPLALYAPGFHRRDPRDLHRELPLDEDELRLNLMRVMAFVTPQVDRCELLTKPLADAAGGIAHAGGTQFADTSDWDYRALRAWAFDCFTAGSP